MSSRIQSAIEALIAKQGFEAAPPATGNALASVEQTFGGRLSEPIRKFLLQCNGLRNDKMRLEFLSTTSMLSCWPAFEAWAFVSELKLLLALDACDSNPLCVITQGPLTGMVAHIFHDGDSCLRFQSLEEMLTLLAESESAVEAYDSKTVTTLPPKDRSPGLSKARVELLQKRGELEDPNGESLLMCFALDLCADDEVTQIGEILESGDEYVRSRALSRLSAIDSEEARALLSADERAFDEFVEAIQSRGTPDRVRTLNMNMLFARRQDSDFEDWLERLLG